jgi:hypothetical protein
MSDYVGFEVFTAGTMKNGVFWDVAPCWFIINRRFVGKCSERQPSNTFPRSTPKKHYFCASGTDFC